MSEIKVEMLEEEVMGGGVSDNMSNHMSHSISDTLYCKLRELSSQLTAPTSTPMYLPSVSMEMPKVTISIPTVSVSIPAVSTPVSTPASEGLPALVPVSSPDRMMSPSITRIMSSSSDVPWVNGYKDIMSNNIMSSSIMSNAILSNSINSISSMQQQQQPNNILRNNTDINQQARKLAELLIKARSNLLLNSSDGQNPEDARKLQSASQDLSSLTKVIKTDQVLQLLQHALEQRRNLTNTFASNAPSPTTLPSVILGGNRPLGGNLPQFNSIPQQPQDFIGSKRKNCKVSPNKNQKKSKHVGGSHGIQLWQFILELLGDKDHKNVLCWTGNGLEFRIINSVELARLWGIRKRNPIMNFDKLSRALRYYYEKNIIKHNPMHRLVYSFCNNPQDLIYNSLLNRALITCPIDADLAKLQVGDRPYKDNIPISVSLESIRNMANISIPLSPLDDDKSPCLPVNR